MRKGDPRTPHDARRNADGGLRYEILAKDWAAQTGEYAAVIDEICKHVFSSTVEMAAWNNSTIVNRLRKNPRCPIGPECFVETRSDAGALACARCTRSNAVAL